MFHVSTSLSRNTSRTCFGISLLLGLTIGLTLGITPAWAEPGAVLGVDTTTDSNDTAYQACTPAPDDCSLRGAISAAGGNTITLPAGNYTLTIAGPSEDDNATGDLDLTSELTINGAGADATIIDADQIDRVLQVHNGASVRLNGMTLTNGKTPVAPGIHCRAAGFTTRAR